MGFFDEVNKILGGAFGPAKPKGLGGSDYLSGAYGGGYGPDNRGLGPLQGPPPSPYQQNAEDILSINQVSETPFKVFDITPYYVPKADFPCIYTRGAMRDLIGPELDSEIDGAASANVTEDGGLPYFRTVPITVNGNFVKVEFLPNRIHEADSTPNVNAGLSDYENLQTSVDASKISNTLAGLGITPSENTPYWYSTGGGTTQYAASQIQSQQSKNIVLVSFDSQQAIPLIAEHGTVFKCPFNTIYITFKTGSPRLRVTTGYNTEIVTPVADRAANANLAMATSHALLEKPLLHFEPFSMTNFDASLSPLTAVASSASSNLILVDSLTALVAVGNRPLKKGVTCLWLTDFYFNYDSPGETASVVVVEFFISDTSGVLRRLVKKIGIRQRTAAGTNDNIAYTRQFEFSTPIRVSLHEDEQLRIKIYNGSSVAINFTYTVGGYSYGRWRFNGENASADQRPIILLDLMTEHPYFLDNFKTIGRLSSSTVII